MVLAINFHGCKEFSIWQLWSKVEFRLQMTNHKDSRMSVGVKRECSLFSSFQNYFRWRALPDLRQNFFFQKQTARGGSSQKQRLCVSLLRSTHWSLCLLTSLLSTISMLQALPGPCFWSGRWALQWWSWCYPFRLKSQKPMTQSWRSKWTQMGRKEREQPSVLITNIVCCAKTKEPQGQQTCPAACC